MKYTLFPVIFFSLVSLNYSCKKIVDDVQQSVINSIIADGIWIITKFEVGSNDLKGEYVSFEFQFYPDGKVIARQTGSPDLNGTWSSNTADLTITSNFPGATSPIDRFNGVWLITKVSEVLVEASKDVAGVSYQIRLQKK